MPAAPVSCPRCRAPLGSAAPMALGTAVRCPKCGTPFTVSRSSPIQGRPSRPGALAKAPPPTSRLADRRTTPTSASLFRNPLLVPTVAGGLLFLGMGLTLAVYLIAGSRDGNRVEEVVNNPPAMPPAAQPRPAPPVEPEATPPRPTPEPAQPKGRAKCYSFPLDVFEKRFLQRLKEIDAHEILNGDDGPDETAALAGQLAGVEARIAELEAELLQGDVAALARVLRQLEEQKRRLAADLAEARQRAAHPLSESWGEAQSLLDVLDNAPDPTDARLRLRSALRRIVDSIWLLVIPRGRDRVCACQVWFSGGERQRSYVVYHQPPKANGSSRQEGDSWVESFADVAAPGDLDLRQRADARKLEAALEGAEVE